MHSEPAVPTCLRQAALDAFRLPHPAAKAGAAQRLATLDTPPGRPARPPLVHPARVPRRSPFKPEGLAALLHAIAHIEFNAIKNALHSGRKYCV